MCKKNTHILLFLFLPFILLFAACSNSKLDSLEFIIGKWETKSGIGTSYETWTRVNDTLFEGNALYIINGDTAFTEELKIVFSNNEINYIALPNGQEETAFKLVKAESKKAVFENPTHDFPNRISYTRTYEDSLSAIVEGKVDGQEVINKFNWGKKK